MTFLSQMGLMFLGVLAVIWVRTVWAAKATETEWDWRQFLFSNGAKFVLSFVGVLILGTAAYNDAAGVQSWLEALGTSVQLGVGFGFGTVIGAFVLIVPSTK